MDLLNPARPEPTEAATPQSGLRLADFSICYPVTITMIVLSLMVLGAVSIFKIPLVMIPDVSFPFIQVVVPYPNNTPAQIQESITKPLEETLSTIPHVQRLTSLSTDDRAFVFLYFVWGQDMDLVRAKVREKVEQTREELPKDVDRIFVQNWSSEDIPIIEGRIASGRDLRGAYDFLDLKIKKPLERIPGVAEVDILGVDRQEINIYLRLDDIKRYRVDVSRLFRRLDSANLNVSLGKVEDGGLRYSVLTRGVMASMEDIRNFPVNERGVKLSDVADISIDNPRVNFGRHLNGEYAIALAVRKSSQANTVETVNRVMAKIEELNQDPALEGIQVLVRFNAGEQITRSLSGLLVAGTTGMLLAVIVLLGFLRRLNATLTIGLTIPFSILASVGFLYLLGKTLNVLSMMGLMLATGMLVDNAVVVLESIYQYLEKGTPRLMAARLGTQSVITAVAAATLTSIIIFVPLVFGKKTNYSIWLADTGTAIILALLCSLFISLTLVPMVVARLLRIDLQRKSRWHQWLNRQSLLRLQRLRDRLRPRRILPEARLEGDMGKGPVNSPGRSATEIYLRMVGWPLQHCFLVGFVLVPALVISSVFLLVKKVSNNSPEARELEALVIRYEFTENYHYRKIEHQYVMPVERFLLDNRERFKIRDVYSQYGNNRATTRIFFDKTRITLEELTEIRPQIARELPVIAGAEITPGRQAGAQTQNQISVNIYGDDSNTLWALAREAKRRLKKKPGFIEVHTEHGRGREEVQITLHRTLAKKYNVSPKSVAETLRIVVRGRKVRGYRTPKGEVDIWVRLLPGDREDLDDLQSIVVGGGRDRRGILLEQVAGLQIADTPGEIMREGRRTLAQMFAIYTGDQKEEGKRIMSEVMNTLDYPPGYGWAYGFWTQRQEKEDQDFFFNFLLALFMVYFVMASLFESLAHPFAIMVSLPFALVGVGWFLFLTGTPFNLMAMIGLMVLLGIVVNNGVILVDHINNLRRQGMPRSQAILEGCRERFRPILMTASTTIVGLIPLALGTSGMFELRYFPLARTVMGGLISSTVLTLIVLPTYYTLVDDFTIWLRRTWAASDPDRSKSLTGSTVL